MHVDVQGWKERRGGGEEEGDIVLEVTQKQLKRERERERVTAGRTARERRQRTMMSPEQVALCQSLHHEQ